jgi:hypothetical protein
MFAYFSALDTKKNNNYGSWGRLGMKAKRPTSNEDISANKK